MSFTKEYTLVPKIKEFRQPEHIGEKIDNMFDDEFSRFNCKVTEHLVESDAMQDLIKDDNTTPCGCCGSNADIYTMGWYGSQIFVPQKPGWAGEPNCCSCSNMRSCWKCLNCSSCCDCATTNDCDWSRSMSKQIGPDGVEYTSICWCPVQAADCMACKPFFNVFHTWGEDPELWHCDDHFIDALKFNGNFSYRAYVLDKQCRDYEWQDVFLCIRYHGVFNKPRAYHVLYYTNPLLSRFTVVGPTVPREIYHNGFRTDVVTSKVIPGKTTPAVEMSRVRPSSLGTMAALSTHRVFDLLPSQEREFAAHLLKRYLDNFRVSDGYLLPIPAVSCHETVPPHNFSQAVQLVACADDRDGPEVRDTIIQNQQHNVDLAETTEPSTSHVANVEFGVLPYFYDECHTYPDLTERWVRFTDFQWTTNQAAGSVLFRYDLPLDAILNTQNTPNALPWRQHAFFRSDMEVMLQINSQPAQSGIIVMGTMYNASELTGASARVTDVAHVMQMPHIELQAGASNSGILKIPWMRHFPISPTLDSNWDYPLYYHTLFIAVLAPLRTGADGPITADLVLQVRFPNLEFYGMRNTVEVVSPTFLTATAWERDLTEEGVEPNPGPIFGTALAVLGGIKTAASTISSVAGTVSNIASSIGSFGSKAKNVVDSTEGLLRKVHPKQDMDRPQDIREPVNMYLQQNTSLALASGVNKLKLLQLQAENSVTHPPAFVPSDEQFNSAFVTQVFGQVDLVQWSTNQVRGTRLFNWPVTPINGKVINSSVSTAARFIPTPMGAISSYYSGYHGNMLMRLTFAISKFHSGRVYIVYSPDQNPNPDNVGALYATLLDVQDQSQYTFVVPYQVPSTFAPIYADPRGFTVADNSDILTGLPYYGYVSIYVENELKVMETASSTIDIVVELAGAPDFALQLPCGSPLRNLPSVVPTTLEATGMEGEPVEQQVDQGDERTKVMDASTPLRVTYPAWALNLNETYDIRDVVKRYITWFSRDTLSSNTRAETLQFFQVSVYHSPLSSINLNTPITNPTWTRSEAGDLAAILSSSQMIACERINFNTNNTISFRVPWTTNASILSNGIDPTLRLNQLPAYCNGRVHVVLEDGVSSFQHISWDVTLGSAEQRPIGFRPDLITTLHDSFRYCKSDFNYQLDFTISPSRNITTFGLTMRVRRAMGDGGNFYIFQGFPSYNNVFIPGVNLIGGRSSPAGTRGIEGLKSPHTRVFSQPRAYVSPTGIVIRPDPVRDLTKDGDVESNPGPVFSRPEAGPSSDPPGGHQPDPESEYFTTEEQEEMGRAGMTRRLYNKVSSYLRTVRRMPRDTVDEFWRRYEEKKRIVVDLTDSVRTVSEFVKNVEDSNMDKQKFERAFEAFESIGKASENFNNIYEKFSTPAEASVALMEQSLRYGTFIINVWQSNSIYQTLLNIVALLSEMGACRLVASHIVEYFSTTAMADGDEEDELSRGWTSLVISGILATLGVSAVVLKGSNIYDGLLKETKEYFRTGFNVKKFLDSHFKCIKELWSWVKFKVFGGETAPNTENLAEDLTVWMEKVHTLTEVYNFEHLLSDPQFAQRVMDLQDESGKFDIQFAISKRPAPAMYSVNKGRLQRAIDTLGKQGGLRRNRCTPFCIWVYGASGAGKSHMSDELLINVGEVLGVRSNDPIYYRSLDVEYWNGYNQQKLIAYQDFAKITTGEDFKRHVSELSSLIEPYPVNPPFAELEDKKRIADAVAVLVTSNHAFPQVQNIGMEVDSLFFRRRHVLMHIRFKEEIVERYRAKDPPIELVGTSGNQIVYYPNKILDSDRERYGEYFYLEFGFHTSGISRTAPVTYVSYQEAISRVRDEALLHRQKELKSLERKGPLYARLKPEHEITGNEFRERIFTATADEVPRPIDIDLLEMEDVPVNDATSGRMQIRLHPTGSTTCDCHSEVDGRIKTRFYCKSHYPGAQHQVITKEVLREAIESEDPISAPPLLAFVDEKTIPNNPRDPTGLLMNWFNTRYARRLPEGYQYWHNISLSCCHQPNILQRAYFENVGGKVEVVLDYYLSERDLPNCSIWSSSTKEHCKVVLTPACPVSVYNSLVKLKNHPFVGDLEFSQSDRVGALGVKLLRDSAKCRCDLSKPFRGFCVVDGVVRMYARGTLFELDDPEVQAAALNQCFGIAGTTTEDVIKTFFAYEYSGKERWRHYTRRALSGLSDIITTLKYVAIAGAAIWTIYKIYKSVAAMFAMQATASQSGDIRRTDNVKNPPLRFTPAKAAAVTLTATGEEKIIALSNNFVKVSKGRLTMWGIRLCHDFVMVPYHLLVSSGDLEIQTLMSGVFGPPIKFTDAELRIAQLQGEHDALDLAVVKLIGLPAAKNIVNYFCSEREASSLKSLACWIKPVGERVTWGDSTIQPYYCTNVSYSNPGMEKMKTELLGFKMKNYNNPHKCGTLIMSNDVICGMIIAATTLAGESFAVSVSREMVVEGLRVLGATPFDMKMKITPIDTVEGTPKMLPPEEGDFILVGKAGKGLTYSGKTRLTPSIIQGEISEPFRFPAAQKLEATGERTGFDVVMNGCRRQFNRPKTIARDEVEKITEYLIERIVPSSPPTRIIGSKPVDLDTAILGIPKTRYSAMKLNTAIGWPLMCKFPKGQKKSDIIKINEERTEVKIHKYALEEYVSANEGRKRAVCAPTVFMDFPKDELLKVGKATRLINGAPLHHTLDMRRYLGEFLESIVHLGNKIAVGIDVHSTDWVEVNAGQNDVVNEDYKNFGPGFHSQWIDVISEIAVAWTKRYKTNDPEYENVIRCLFRELQNATHIAGDLIFQVLCGSPSGAFATDRINSLANICYHCLCYLRKYSTLVGFWEYYLTVYGDDTRRSGKAYSYEEFRDCMASIGITVELDKGGNTFLKREFRPYSYKGINILLAPLPLPIVGDIVNWVKKPIFDPVSALEQSVDSYLSEMFHHGQERFDTARSQIQEIFARFGRNPELKDFNTIWVEKYGKVGILPTGSYVNERGEILKHGIAATFLGDLNSFEDDEGYSVE